MAISVLITASNAFLMYECQVKGSYLKYSSNTVNIVTSNNKKYRYWLRIFFIFSIPQSRDWGPSQSRDSGIEKGPGSRDPGIRDPGIELATGNSI